MLIDRGRELARIDAALEAAMAGGGAIVLIEGEAGIGKTSLLAEARARAEAVGMARLGGRGSQLESEYALGVVRQCFETELRGRGGQATRPPADVAVGAILDGPAGADAAPEAVLRGLYALTAQLADDGPLLIAVDDAHWADEASLRFLAYLARRLESLPVALVVGTRPAEDAGVGTVLDELRREPRTDVLEPAPLDVAGVESFLRSAQSSPVASEFAAACHEATGGNPFLVSELVRALRAKRIAFTAAGAGLVTDFTPSTIARSVRATLYRLGSSCEALARAVAVLGDDVEVDLAAALADLPTMEATFAAGELTRARLLADATPLRFRHPLLAAAARATLTAPEQMAAHARAAELLRDRGAGPEQVALQLMHAGPSGDARAAEELRAAARRASGRGAPAIAAALLSRALEEPPPVELRAEFLLELARAEAAVGRTGDAAAHLREAHECARDHTLRGHVVLALLDAVGGDMREVFALESLVVRARAEVAVHDRELALRLSCAEAICGEPQGILERHAAALDLAGETPGEALALGILVVPMVFGGRTGDELDDIVSRVHRQAGRIVAEAPMSLLTTSLHLGLLLLDRLDEDLSLLDDAVATAQRRGSSADIALAFAARAESHRRAGRLGEAEADGRIALAAGGEAGWAGGGQGAIIPLVGALVDRGRLDEAARLLSEAYPDGRAIPDHPHMNFLLLERMYLRIAQARHGEALADWTEYVRRAERLFGIDSVVLAPAMCAAAGLHSARGEHEVAVALVERALGHARAWGRPGRLGAVLVARARLEAPAAAVETLREAVALQRSSPARLELARALVALGGVMRRSGDRSASREPLREGYELAARCGADGLAELARAELRASGVRVRREVPDGVEGLTVSERRVAELAAAGTSNANIAQTLFLTIKTVEMHLTRTYRKLDIGGRGELAHALLGAGTGSTP